MTKTLLYCAPHLVDEMCAIIFEHDVTGIFGYSFEFLGLRGIVAKNPNA